MSLSVHVNVLCAREWGNHDVDGHYLLLESAVASLSG